jgi:hypothetical protein
LCTAEKKAAVGGLGVFSRIRAGWRIIPRICALRRFPSSVMTSSNFNGMHCSLAVLGTQSRRRRFTLSDALKKMLALAREVPPMGQEQKERQRRSFAYGNTHFENPRISREMVDQQAEKLARNNKMGYAS